MLILQEIAKPVDWQEHLRALFQTVTAQGMCQDMHLLVYLQDKLVVPFQTAIAVEMHQEAVLLVDLREWGNISNCYSSGNVSGSGSVGGFAGNQRYPSKVSYVSFLFVLFCSHLGAIDRKNLAGYLTHTR